MSPAQLRTQLELVLADKADQGHDVAGLDDELQRLDGLDAMAEFADRLADLPIRADWPWDEPTDLDEIRLTAAWPEPASPRAAPDEAARIETAFNARVAGCILGKPFELDLTLDAIEAALDPLGLWPLTDYVPEAVLDRLPHRIGQWAETTREHITYVAPDDDINYSILAMLLLERHGTGFSLNHLRNAWLTQLPLAATFGPEREMLVRAGQNSLDGGDPASVAEWASVLNPREEWCGALIRVDPYGYACPGDPGLAATLAWRDASFTHRRTGLYAAMFVAAALALAPVRHDPLDVFADALAVVPGRSRFAAAVADALGEVERAVDWRDGYARIHRRFPEHTHCRILQEVGTLVNTLRFAESAGDAICLQVMQGNDTDSFGATAGSLAGLFFGPGSLGDRWTEPFGDDLRVALAVFHERSLRAVSERMGRLPAILRGDIAGPTTLLPY